MQRTRGSANRWKLAVATVSCVIGPLTVPRDASADGQVAKRWVEQAFTAVRSGNPAIHTGTPAAARLYAMVTAAM